MKRIISIFLVLLLVMMTFASCGKNDEGTTKAADNKVEETTTAKEETTAAKKDSDNKDTEKKEDASKGEKEPETKAPEKSVKPTAVKPVSKKPAEKKPEEKKPEEKKPEEKKPEEKKPEEKKPEEESFTPTLFTDIVYGKDPVAQSLNLVLPIGKTGEVPLVLHIHGGTWMGGSKEDYGDYPMNDCRNYGIAGASINYRFIKKNSIDANDIMDDITASLAKIKEFAAEKGIIIKEMMIDGFSAGAHLALLYGYSRVDEAPIKPVCVFSRSVPTNMASNAYMHSTVGSPIQMCRILSALSGKSFTVLTRKTKKTQNALLSVSPIAYISQNTVPTAIFHGKNDTLVLISEAETLDRLLSENNVPHDTVIFPNSGHNLESPLDSNCYAKMDELYEQYVNVYLLDINP